MKVNWQAFVERLKVYPAGTNELRPPASNEELEWLRAELGQPPSELISLLRHFNGAELFIAPEGGGPMITMFSSADLPPPPPLIESSGFSIDRFTRRWRSAANSSRDRSSEWAIGMMNYGGLIILDMNNKIREWDTAQSKWDPREWEIDDWADYLIGEGEAFLKEAQA